MDRGFVKGVVVTLVVLYVVHHFVTPLPGGKSQG